MLDGMDPLTKNQKSVLRFILKNIRDVGYPPSIRDIGDEFDMKSHTGAVRYLEALEKKGYIRRSSGYIQVLGSENDYGQRDVSLIYLPVIGSVAAGRAILAEENISGYEPVSARLVRSNQSFLLRVEGSSMIGDHILNGDFVIVDPTPAANNGEIVVAIVDGEDATIKRFYKTSKGIELRPSNPDYEIIRGKDNIRIQGRVTGVLRGI